MYVKLPNPPAKGLRVPDVTEVDEDGEEVVVHAMSDKYRESGVDVPESGVVQVDRETGATLIEQIPGAEEHEAGDGS